MNGNATKYRVKEPEMRPEYDFSGGVRAKYHERYVQSSNVVGPTKRSTRKRSRWARAGNR